MYEFEQRLDSAYSTETVIVDMYQEYTQIHDATNARSIQILENVRHTLPQLSSEMKSLFGLMDEHGSVIKANETDLQREKFTYFRRQLQPMTEVINLAVPDSTDKK